MAKYLWREVRHDGGFWQPTLRSPVLDDFDDSSAAQVAGSHQARPDPEFQA